MKKGDYVRLLPSRLRCRVVSCNAKTAVVKPVICAPFRKVPVAHLEVEGRLT